MGDRLMARRPGSAANGPWRSLVLLATLAVLLVTGCNSEERLPRPRHDEALSEALIGAREESRAVPLAELTDFSWDTVYVFRSYASGESINTVVGQEVVDSSYHHSYDNENVLIFVLDGMLVHAATVRRVGIGPGSNTFFRTASSDAWLVPADDPGGPLGLVEEPPDE